MILFSFKNKLIYKIMDRDEFIGKKETYVHQCKLPRDSIMDYIENNNKFYINIFVKLCFLTKNDSHRKNYIKSKNILHKERVNQFQNYHWIIHPFSEFTYYFEIFMIIIFLGRLTLMPFFILSDPPYLLFKIIKYSVRCLAITYIIIQFFTGYYIADTKEVVLNHKMIVRNYLKTYFTPDFIGNFPMSEILDFFNVDEYIIKVFKCLVVLNIFSLIKWIESFREKQDMNPITFKIINTVVIFVICLEWLIALTYLSFRAINTNVHCNISNWWWAYHVYSMVLGYRVQKQFTDESLILANVLSLLFGFIIRSILLVELVLWGQTFFFNENKKYGLKTALNEFCYYHKIPNDLKNKLLQYYDYKFQNVYYNEMDIYELLSESIKHNIETYESKQWFETDLFKFCPITLKQLIIMNIEKEIFLKHDVIYTVGSKCIRLYLLKYGMVILYDSDEKPVHKVRAGEFFSKRTLLKEFSHYHKHKAVVVENSTIYTLSGHAFKKIMHAFPDQYTDMLKIIENNNIKKN